MYNVMSDWYCHTIIENIMITAMGQDPESNFAIKLKYYKWRSSQIVQNSNGDFKSVLFG